MNIACYNLARKPSLSTIASVDAIEQNPLPLASSSETDRKEIFAASDSRLSQHLNRPSFQSPARAHQASSLADMEKDMQRPTIVRVPSTETRYMQMLLHLDRIPRVYNFLAGVFTWILLASFLIIPGTFTSFKNSDAFKNIEGEDSRNAFARMILDSAANVGLLWLSGAFCMIGGTGCLFLWFRWRKNYVWLVNKVFL